MLLRNQDPGTYLMRYSKGSFVLSFVTPDCGMKHIGRIIPEKDGSGVNVTTKNGESKFPRVHEFLDSMKKAKPRLISHPIPEDYDYAPDL